MPPKRARVEDVTGGSGDVNPQFMNIAWVPASAGTTETIGVVAPISRMATHEGRANVMEILKVFFQVPAISVLASATEINRTFRAMLSTQSHGATLTGMEAPDVFATCWMCHQGAFSAGGTYGETQPEVYVVDLTDGAGHGVLIATDTIHTQLAGTASLATSFRCKILYRVKEVGMMEYIGIVQSQQ